MKQEDVNEAQIFLKGDHLIITPRKQIPAGVIGDKQKNLKAEECNEEGRILCTCGDAGWGNIVAKNKYKDGKFGEGSRL